MNESSTGRVDDQAVASEGALRPHRAPVIIVMAWSDAVHCYHQIARWDMGESGPRLQAQERRDVGLAKGMLRRLMKHLNLEDSSTEVQSPKSKVQGPTDEEAATS